MDSLDASLEEDHVSEQDILKLFLFILLLLNRPLNEDYQPALLKAFEFHPQSIRACTPTGIHLAAGTNYAALCARGKAYMWGINRAGR